MISWLLALLASSQVPYELLALVNLMFFEENTEMTFYNKNTPKTYFSRESRGEIPHIPSPPPK